MDDEVQGSQGRRSAAKRALLGAASPLIGYFDRRFQELHEHLDRPRPGPDLDPHLNAHLDEISAISRQTRQEVKEDADTIAELAFTLERFADLFTARMEEIVETTFSTGSGAAPIDAQVVELPFAYAAADRLPADAEVATVGGDTELLPLALASLNMRVTALQATGMPTGHPNLSEVAEPVERWSGPARPLHAVFALSAVGGLGLDRDDPVEDLDRQVVDLFRKWLRPDGLLVLSVAFGEWSVDRRRRTYDERHLAELLADWEIREQRVMERIDDHVWRLVDSDAPSHTGMALISAIPRS